MALVRFSGLFAIKTSVVVLHLLRVPLINCRDSFPSRRDKISHESFDLTFKFRVLFYLFLCPLLFSLFNECDERAGKSD